MPTVTEKIILKNSFQKVRVERREYNPSRAKIIKKNGATTSTIFKYALKEKSNKTGLISITFGVNRNQKARIAAVTIIAKSTGTRRRAKNSSDFFIFTKYEMSEIRNHHNIDFSKILRILLAYFRLFRIL